MAAPPVGMSGKGLMFVNSRIMSPLLDERTFLKWYDEDHIPEILATSGMPTAIRYIDEVARSSSVNNNNNDNNSSSSSDDQHAPVRRPYVQVYPVQDVGFFKTPEFARISVTSDLLPGSKLVYDLVDFDVRFYNLVQVYDPTKKGPGHTKSVFLAQAALKEGYPDEDFDRWCREEHLNDLANINGYLRTTQYRLLWARNSDTSGALKGGSSDRNAGTEATAPTRVPEWFALHEFETEEVDVEAMRRGMTDWTRKISGNSEFYDVRQMKLDRAAGRGGIFDREDVSTPETKLRM